MVIIKKEYGWTPGPRAYRAAYKVGQYLGKKTAAYMSKKSNSKSRAARATDYGPITAQYDFSKRYQRKAMPKWKRKRWVRFTKRVNHVMLQSQALASWTRDILFNFTAAADTQVTFGWYLGGVGAPDNNELQQVFNAAYGSPIFSALDDYKLFIKSLCLDIQISNPSTRGVILDVYTLIARAGDNQAAETIGTMYNRLYNEQQSTTVGLVSPTNPASTPFQNSLFCSKWKILSKKEILLQAGGCTTMQMRNPVNKMMYGKTLESNNSYIPGYTRAYLVQARGVPEIEASVSRLAPVQLVCGGQWTVVYGIPPGQTRATASDV